MVVELGSVLGKKLSELGIIKKNGGAILVPAKDAEAGKMAEGDWIYLSYIYNYGLTRPGPGRREPFAHIALQIVMADEEVIGLGINEAVVHVLYATAQWGKDDFTVPPSVGMKDWADAENWKCELKENCLWEFSYDPIDNSSERGWAFSVPLATLNTEEDLLDQIVNPIAGLLQDQPVAEAMRTASQVLRFEGDATQCKRIKPSE
jgi:hypothetical protein